MEIEIRKNSLRLSGYDYTQSGLYFITICTKNRQSVSGDIVNGEMKLNKYGIIAQSEWNKTINLRENVQSHEIIVMPNHIHAIIEICNISKNTDGIGHGVGARRAVPANNEILPTNNKMSANGHGKPCPYDVPVNDAKIPANNKSQFGKPVANSLSVIIGGYKSAVSRNIHAMGVVFAWQRNFNDHIIRDNDEYEKIVQYIRNNPANWAEDKQ
jgi:REP element-mobilizing transposase RayT